jgi:hypothetical protein
VTPVSSVEASQASDTLDVVEPVVRRLPGVVGGTESGGAPPATGVFMSVVISAAERATL